MRFLRFAALGALMLASALGGCSKGTPTAPTGKLAVGRVEHTPTPGDTTPGDSVPPPAGTVLSPVEFFGSDTTARAGETATTRWRLGNNNTTPFTMHWTLSCEAGWPGFPMAGTVALPAHTIVPLDLRVPIPPGSPSGWYSLEMLVDDPAGGIFTRPGEVRVHP